MPEGPEVRRYATQLHKALSGRPLVALEARTRVARQWLADHPLALIGKRVVEVRSHGKNLVGRIEGGFYFHSHLMMWGRWIVEGHAPYEPLPEKDRRERARIVVPGAIALLYSAPIFELGRGNPYQVIEHLRELGPDILPGPGNDAFDASEFIRRLNRHREKEIGSALLDQKIVAGIGNYLRAEILFRCRIDPWKKVRELSRRELEALVHRIPEIALQAYKNSGMTTMPDDRQRILDTPGLTYRIGSDYGSHHYVFRRTNLPCIDCGETVRQLRQVTRKDETGEKSRIIYFCPRCQDVGAGAVAKSAGPGLRSAVKPRKGKARDETVRKTRTTRAR